MAIASFVRHKFVAYTAGIQANAWPLFLSMTRS
jgi:hypothetical protein